LNKLGFGEIKCPLSPLLKEFIIILLNHLLAPPELALGSRHTAPLCPTFVAG